MEIKIWLDFIKKHSGRWTSKELLSQFNKESLPNLELFKKMDEYGFVSVDSQEGKTLDGLLPADPLLYASTAQDVFRKTKEDPVPRSVLDEAYKKRGGKFAKSVGYSQRPYLTVCTIYPLGYFLQNLLNFHTTLYASLVKNEGEGLDTPGSPIPVSFMYNKKNYMRYGIKGLMP